MTSFLRGAAALTVSCAAAYGLYQLGVAHGQRAALPPIQAPADGLTEASADLSANSIAAGEAATRRHIERGLKAGDIDPANGRKILHYHDPMVPGQRFDAPAKSPFMDMMLVPMYAGNGGGNGDAKDGRGDNATVQISARVQQNLGLRTAEVKPGRLQLDTSAVGRVARAPGQVLADLPESQASRVRPGATAEVRAIALPGEVFTGEVHSLASDLDTDTHTRQVRIRLTTAPGALLPGMAVVVKFNQTRSESALLIPTEALIETGRRSLVMRAEADGHFTPVVVEAGLESNGQTEIKRGLQPGQRVVMSGQFLIDSEASLKGVEARLNAAGDQGEAKP